MLRASQLGILAVLCFSLPRALAADDTKKKVDGVHGRIKAVNVDKGTLTVTTDEGQARTFQVKADTHVLGPRGGAVPQRLKDKGFRPGMDITVVPAADGRAAKALHLRDDQRPPITKNLKGQMVNQVTQAAPTKPNKTVKGNVVAVDLKKGFTSNKTFKISPDTKFVGPKGAERKSK